MPVEQAINHPAGCFRQVYVFFSKRLVEFYICRKQHCVACGCIPKPVHVYIGNLVHRAAIRSNFV